MPSADYFDLAIIGGGPAGTCAAITAARAGANVVLFEARAFPRHKVCGEFVSAEALDVLKVLMADRCALAALLDTAPVIGRTRFWRGSRMLESQVEPASLSITRYELDSRLWAEAHAAGVHCYDNCEVSGVSGQGPFLLEPGEGTISSRALIVAAGRWSQFTPDRSVPAGPKWLGLKAHFREPSPSLTTDLYFFDNGYCGVEPVGPDMVNACAMVRSDRASSLAEVFQLQPALALRAASWTPATQPVTTAPLIYRQPQPVRDNVAFIGDTAGFIDPFVGDGISIALRSGRAAAEHLSKFLSGRCTLEESLATYQAQYARDFAPLFAVASRVRSLMGLPRVAQAAVFELLRFPGLMPLLIRKTRRAAC